MLRTTAKAVLHNISADELGLHRHIDSFYYHSPETLFEEFGITDEQILSICRKKKEIIRGDLIKIIPSPNFNIRMFGVYDDDELFNMEDSYRDRFPKNIRHIIDFPLDYWSDCLDSYMVNFDIAPCIDQIEATVSTKAKKMIREERVYDGSYGVDGKLRLIKEVLRKVDIITVSGQFTVNDKQYELSFNVENVKEDNEAISLFKGRLGSRGSIIYPPIISELEVFQILRIN